MPDGDCCRENFENSKSEEVTTWKKSLGTLFTVLFVISSKVFAFNTVSFPKIISSVSFFLPSSFLSPNIQSTLNTLCKSDRFCLLLLFFLFFFFFLASNSCFFLLLIRLFRVLLLFFLLLQLLPLDKSTKKQKSENHLSHPDILPTVLGIILEHSSILIFILQMARLPLPSLKSKNTSDPLLTGSKTGILIILYSFMNIFRFLLSSPVFSPHRSPVLSTARLLDGNRTQIKLVLKKQSFVFVFCLFPD